MRSGAGRGVKNEHAGGVAGPGADEATAMAAGEPTGFDDRPDPDGTSARAGHRTPLLVLAGVLVLLAAVALLAVPAKGQAADADADLLVRLLNDERARQGLSALHVLRRLSDVTGTHTRAMADQHDLHHNPNLDGQIQPATAWGENVGFAGDARGLHQAWMNSPGHRANILSPAYNAVGVATARSGNSTWGTQDFAHVTDAELAGTPAPGGGASRTAAGTSTSGSSGASGDGGGGGEATTTDAAARTRPVWRDEIDWPEAMRRVDKIVGRFG